MSSGATTWKSLITVRIRHILSAKLNRSGAQPSCITARIRVGHEQVPRFLDHSQQGPAAQWMASQGELVAGHFIIGEFDLPVLMIQEDHLLGGRSLRLQQ